MLSLYSISYPQAVHSFYGFLWATDPTPSAERGTYPQKLWISAPNCGQKYQKYRIWRKCIAILRYMLWINLWITGVKSVDKPVEDYVDNSRLWINCRLSTFLPQEKAGYPQFYPQPRLWVLGLGKGDPDFIHTVHRAYYYYYSKNLMI